MPDQNLLSIGTILVFAGLLLALFAILLPLLKAGRLKGRGGGVVIIGPFPIVFGSDKEAGKALLGLAIVLVTVSIGLFLLLTLFSG